MRLAFLAVAITFIAGLFALTVIVAVQNGFSFLTLISLGIIAVMGIGIIGALGKRPPK